MRKQDITKEKIRFNSVVTRYRKKIKELVIMKVELQDIFRVNQTLSSTIDFKKIFSLITRFTCKLIGTHTCVLRLLDESKKILMVNSSYSHSNGFIKKILTLKVGEGISGRVAKTRKPLVVYDIDKDHRVKYKELMKKEGLCSILAVPIIFQDNLLGVISTGSKKARQFTKEEIEVLSVFAFQIAIAIQQSKYFQDIHNNYFDTIHAMVLALEARDHYVRGHTERVTEYAVQLGRHLQISKQELEILRYASEVHDLGKISIPDFILCKPGRLTPPERAIIELHPVKSTEVLAPLEFLKPALPVVRHHHERYDGTGYPDGLEKEKIPLMARILACADAFDAMTSDRPYRLRKLTTEEALAEIKNCSGSQFDPPIAHTFIQLIRSQSK